MSPKEKAEDLWLKYYQRLPDSIYSNYAAKMEAKYFALIAVDEIIKAKPTAEYGDPFIGNHSYDNVSYWQSVKQEIEKL